MPPGRRPYRQELEALVRHYHHLESERQRTHRDGSARRHVELRLRETRVRFEHLLAACPDQGSRDAWRAYLHHRRAEPPGPPAASPVVFKGQSPAGSIVEIRRERPDELGVYVDGHLAERLATRYAPGGKGPAVLRLDRTDYREVFDTPPRALLALREFLADGGHPPWQYAEVLLADGLVDADFGLTARGRRALTVGA